MIGTPIAFGLTMIVCFTLFYYYWRIRQLRARLVAAQNTPVPDGFPVEFGIGKNVVETFPTIKACELKCTASEDLQCPICLVEYEDWEVLRQLPFCHHIFHTLCVGAWFEKQTTCPVCRMSMSELTKSFGDLLAAENNMQMHNCRGPPSSDVTTLEVISDANSAPSWLMLNRRGLPSPAVPVPAIRAAITTESTLACTCPQGIGSGDFHVVSIPQHDRLKHTCCSTCKRPSKPVKLLPSDDPVSETHHQSVAQILVQIQETIQTKTRESNDTASCEGETLGLQETSGSNEGFAATQPTVVDAGGAVTNSRCVSNAEDSRRNSGDVRVQEGAQMVSEELSRGSFEFKPVT